MSENSNYEIRPLVLGIPVDSLKPEEAVRKIMGWIEDYVPKTRSRLVSFLNTPLILKAIGWHPFSQIHPEIIEILRKSDLVLVDINPLFWSIITLGQNRERLPSYHHLLGSIIDRLENRKVILFAPTYPILERIEKWISARNSKVQFESYVKPSLVVTGEKLGEAEELDRQLIENINKAGASLLLLALEHPEQEIWFNRVKDKLLVPVTLALGAMNQATKEDLQGVEKSFADRLSHGIKEFLKDPMKESVKIAQRIFKIPFLTVPLIGLHTAGVIQAIGERAEPLLRYCLFQGYNKKILVLNLPAKFTQDYLKTFFADCELNSEFDYLIIDFSHTLMCDTASLGTLMRLWNQHSNKEIFVVNISQTVKQSMRWHRVWDFFEPRLFETTEKLLHHIFSAPGMNRFILNIVQKSPFTVISLFGSLDAEIDHTDLFSRITNLIMEPKVVIDFKWCNFVDSSGLGFLLRLRKHLMQLKKPLFLINLNHSLYQTMKVAKVDQILKIMPAEKIYSEEIK